MPKRELKRKVLYLGLRIDNFITDGELVHLPIIKIVPRPFAGPIQEAFEKLDTFSHVLFTSRTAVSIYLEYAKRIPHLDYICVGRQTAQELQKANLKASYVATDETAEGIVDLIEKMPQKPSHLFFPRSAQGRTVISDYLIAKKIPFTTLDLYDTVPNPIPIPDLETFEEIIFTSPSTVSAFFERVPIKPPLEKCRAIGPITQKRMEEFILNPYNYDHGKI